MDSLFISVGKKMAETLNSAVRNHFLCKLENYNKNTNDMSLENKMISQIKLLIEITFHSNNIQQDIILNKLMFDYLFIHNKQEISDLIKKNIISNNLIDKLKDYANDSITKCHFIEYLDMYNRIVQDILVF